VRAFLITLFCLAGLFSAQAEIRLSECWPEAANEGRFDDLGSRFQFERRLILIPGANWCSLDGEMKRLMSPAWPVENDWLLPNELVGWIQKKGWSKASRSVAESRWNEKVIVVLDAGHGGKDPGAIGLGGTREKDITLDVTKRLKAMLLSKGITVHTTRETDDFVELSHRCELSNQWRASIFVSIHCNSNNSRELQGYQMLRQSDSITIHSRAEFLKNKFPLPDYIPTPSHGPLPRIVDHVDLMRWKDRESMILSEKLNDVFSYRTSNVTNQKGQNLCVMRETMAPSILVEMDFLSNPEIEVKMGTSSWRDRAARDIFEGIMDYLGRGRIN